MDNKNDNLVEVVAVAAGALVTAIVRAIGNSGSKD